MFATSWPGYRVLVARLYHLCVARAAVSNSLVPSIWVIHGTVTSPHRSHHALAFEPSTMRAGYHSPGFRAARSPVTSLAHRTCVACRAGSPERVVPGTRSANRTRGLQHVMPRTCARMGTCAFQIHTTFLLTMHVPVSYHARDISAPASDRANVCAWAVRKTRNGPRTQRPAEPARSQK